MKIKTLIAATLITVSAAAPVQAASIPLNLITSILSLAAGMYSVARAMTATVNNGEQDKDMILRLSDDAALFVATDGQELSSTLAQVFTQMREQIAVEKGDAAARELTELELARMVITAGDALQQ